MVGSVASGSIFFLSIYFSSVLKISVIKIGYIMSSFAIGNILGSFLVSRLPDRVNPYKSSGVIMCLKGGSFLLIPYLSEGSSCFLMLLMGMLVYAGLAMNLYLVASLGDQSDELRRSYLGFQHVFSNIGLGIGSVITGHVSVNSAHALFISIGILLIAFSFFYFPLGKVVSVKAQKKEDRSVGGSKNILHIISLYASFALGIIFAQSRVAYPLLLKSMLSSSAMSIVILANTFLIILFQVSVSRLSSKFNKLLTIAIGFGMLGGAKYLLGYSSNFKEMLFICVLCTIGEMVAVVSTQALCYESASSFKKVKAMGLFKAIFATGLALGSFGAGHIQSQYGASSIWTFCGFVTLLTVTILVTAIYNQQKHRSNLEYGVV